MNLRETQEICSDALDRIKRCFKETARITVIVRHVGDRDGRMDFMMGDDDAQEAMSAIARRMAAERAQA